MYANSALNLALAQQKPPLFSNTREGWQTFAREFGAYLRANDQTFPLNDMGKMTVLTSCLPQALKEEVQLMGRETGGVTFQKFWAVLEQRFGRGGEETARRRWDAVRLQHAGRVKLSEFRSFQVQFKNAWMDVGTATQADARRVLLKGLPDMMAKWVVEESLKRGRARPTFLFRAVNGMDEQGVKTSIHGMIGQTPRRVVVQGEGVYEVQMPDGEKISAFQDLHGRRLAGVENRLGVMLLEHAMSVGDILEFLVGKLEAQEACDACLSSRHEGGPPRNGGERGNRWTRGIDAQSWGGHMLRGGGGH
jgi:hypothetical protein